MKISPPSRRLLPQLVSAALLPGFLGQVFIALPAAAQIEIAPRAPMALGAGVVAVPPASATSGLVQGLPALAAPAAFSLGNIPTAAAVAVAPFAAAPAAAASRASASVPAAASPTGAAAAAHPHVAASVTQADRNRAFQSFVRAFASVHPPLAEALGARLFDGAARSRAEAESFGVAGDGRDILPRSTGLSAVRRPRRAPAETRAPSAAQGIALDADPADPASIEKALRAYVDSAPQRFGAPSKQLAKVSVSILPSQQPGQGASIIAQFRQALQGANKDGSPYELSVAGKSLNFHINVSNGKPVIMSVTGELGSGVTPDAMTVAFDDAELLSIAAQRASAPAARNQSANLREGKVKFSPNGPFAAKETGASAGSRKTAPKSKGKTAPRAEPASRRGKTRPRGGESSDQAEAESSDEPAPAAPKFLSRQLTDQLDGKWRTINIYQAADPSGKPVIVIVDVTSGESVAIGAKDFHTGDEFGAPKHVISGTATGRGVTPTADGGDHGPIASIPLPLTNVYDQNGKVVAVTDERGNFSIPDDGGKTPVKLTIRLAGPLVPFVKDEDAKKNGPVEVTVMATPGEAMTVELNPSSDNPELAAGIVGYVGYINHHVWVKNLPGMDAARMDIPLAGGMVDNGHEEEGNAFYDPATDSVNLMAAAVITVKNSKGQPMQLQVENTAVWSIEDHEDTHRVVQIYSQIQLTPAQQASPVYRFVKWSMDAIMGADVNESIADVVSYFMRDASTIGDGFYGNAPAGHPDYIRSALDKTEYDPKNPDPHNGVLAQAMWAIREGFKKELGEEAGKAYANAMIPVILIAQPLNPIDALFHLVLWDLREDGSSPFGDLIRRIAKDDHGIDLPPTPAAPVPMS